MARQNKHIRFQVAHKAAQMMAEEGISDYAFAKRKAAKFFGLMDGDVLPSNDEINDAIKEHQALFNNNNEQTTQIIFTEAFKIMELLDKFNPYLSGHLAFGLIIPNPTITINLYLENFKEIEFFLINNSIIYKNKKNNAFTHSLVIEHKKYPIVLNLLQKKDLNFKNKKLSTREVKKLINGIK
jgi:hypothetical protein